MIIFVVRVRYRERSQHLAGFRSYTVAAVRYAAFSAHCFQITPVMHLATVFQNSRIFVSNELLNRLDNTLFFSIRFHTGLRASGTAFTVRLRHTLIAALIAASRFSAGPV